MNKINEVVLKYLTDRKSRRDICSSCDLYFYLFISYFNLIMGLAFIVTYLYGIYNLIQTKAPFGYFLLQDSQKEFDSYFHFSMGLVSVVNTLVIAVVFFLLSSSLLYCLVQMISKGIKKLKLSWKISPLCHKLSDKEIEKLRKL